MNREEYLGIVAEAIRENLGLSADHIGEEFVKEEFRGDVVWVGQVELFVCPALMKVIFAWGVNDDGKLEIITVPKTNILFTPREAVRAWIASTHGK